MSRSRNEEKFDPKSLTFLSTIVLPTLKLSSMTPLLCLSTPYQLQPRSTGNGAVISQSRLDHHQYSRQRQDETRSDQGTHTTRFHRGFARRNNDDIQADEPRLSYEAQIREKGARHEVSCAVFHLSSLSSLGSPECVGVCLQQEIALFYSMSRLIFMRVVMCLFILPFRTSHQSFSTHNSRLAEIAWQS